MKKPMLYHLDTAGGGLIGGEEGEFVLFSDYEALKASIPEWLPKNIDSMVRQPAGWTGEDPRWKAVMDVFKVGSATAKMLCRDCNCDPEEIPD